jgi:hypothetical protein
MDITTTREYSESSLGLAQPLSLMLEDQEWIPDLQPRPGGIRFARGVFLGVVLCVPVWVFVWLAIASRF